MICVVRDSVRCDLRGGGGVTSGISLILTATASSCLTGRRLLGSCRGETLLRFTCTSVQYGLPALRNRRFGSRFLVLIRFVSLPCMGPLRG